jgi:hypothetical protein
VPSLANVVHRSERVQGTRLSHDLDVTVRNGHLAAVGQVLPFEYGTPKEIGERRAVLVEAALDLPDDVSKVALYGSVPRGRTELFVHTQEFMKDRFGDSVRLYSTAEFPELVAGLTTTLFDAP